MAKFDLPNRDAKELGMGPVHVMYTYEDFNKYGYPKSRMVQNGKSYEMDDLGVPPFEETSIWEFNIKTPGVEFDLAMKHEYDE